MKPYMVHTQVTKYNKSQEDGSASVLKHHVTASSKVAENLLGFLVILESSIPSFISG